MGYTHYWQPQRPFTAPEWTAIVTDCRALFAATTVPLALEYDEPQEPPVADDQIIRFNGVGDDGHETFLITRDDDESFVFCKTSAKPYDRVVCAVLSAIQRHAPGAMVITSDGGPEMWEDGLAFARQVLGPDYGLPFRARPDAA